ncbi:MAG TPA: hypothetical protein DHW61_00665 [Lachnoclostridium phytofermentans]|uniref:Uncharacterized protein n=1 Tax=Lachnoclostridium phytofermentans TaxID=66219 RepID=A0A3D2X2S1_9FIRM|nr:hypothetical protein [Lachnoclostridium sp.]HCL00933.1 hypothetical protein [Lachnoclostridium phytofermentans]
MKKNFFTDFILCGLSGWCMECFWTGLSSIERKDKTLSCHTSIWMFPIYGLAALISPVSKVIKKRCAFCRGSIYALGIISMEYLTGTLLKKLKACPWDYSKAKLNFKGVIRFDYLPAWFLAGLYFEKLLSHNSK